MNRILTVLTLGFASFGAVNAQIESNHRAEGENGEEKTTGIYEIITSGIYAYSFEHNEGVVGTEIHFTYWINHKWGAGMSYTAKFEEEETLNDIALIAGVNPTSWLTFNIGVNFALAGDHRAFGLGAYTEAEFNIRPTKWFHFGPVIGAVIGKETEGTVGIHLGFEF